MSPFEIFGIDEYGYQGVVAEYSCVEEAKEQLEMALEDAIGSRQIALLQGYLEQVYDALPWGG